MYLKVENLEDIVKEKEAVISSTKAKLASLQADHSTSGSTLSSLEELLVDKERQIDRFTFIPNTRWLFSYFLYNLLVMFY